MMERLSSIMVIPIALIALLSVRYSHSLVIQSPNQPYHHHHATTTATASSTTFLVQNQPPTSSFLSSSITSASASSNHISMLRATQQDNNVNNNVDINDKNTFLQSLDRIDSLNDATKERTKLVQQLVDNKMTISVDQWLEENDTTTISTSTKTKSLEKPGSTQSFHQVASGNWKVIYAPHMTTIATLFGGSLDVQYILHPQGTMESHAKYDFPIIGRGYLSVSGTYDSVDGDSVSRVDFNKAWVRAPIGNSVVADVDNVDGNDNDNVDVDGPYATLEEVPDGLIKNVINAVGKTFFIEQVSVFPVSFLDDDLIVFDFPLLGTRICALKQLN